MFDLTLKLVSQTVVRENIASAPRQHTALDFSSSEFIF